MQKLQNFILKNWETQVYLQINFTGWLFTMIYSLWKLLYFTEKKKIGINQIIEFNNNIGITQKFVMEKLKTKSSSCIKPKRATENIIVEMLS